MGCNALTVYLTAELVDFPGLARRFVGGEIEQAVAPWSDALVGAVALVLMLAFVRFLYRRRLFLRV